MGGVDNELGRGGVSETECREACHCNFNSCMSPVAIMDGFAADLDDQNGRVVCWQMGT